MRTEGRGRQISAIAKLLKVLAGALLLLVAAFLLAIPLVDSNAFKDDIRARVQAATGRELAIDGGVDLSVLPWLGLEIRGARLANAPGLGASPFAELARAEVRVGLIPLLRRRLEVDRVRVEGLRIHLGRDAEGQANWDYPAGAATQAKGAPPPAEPPPPGSAPAPAGQAPLDLAIGGIELVDAHVTWEDRRLGRRLVLVDLTLATGPIAPGAPVELRLAGDLMGPDMGLKARLAAEGTLAVYEGRRLALAPIALHLTDMETAGGVSGELDLTARLDVDLAGRRYRIDGLDLRVEASSQARPEARFQAVAARVAGSIERAGASPAGYRFDLAADRIDLDRYLPSREARPVVEKTAEPPASKPRPEAKPPPPAETGRATAPAPAPPAAPASPPSAILPLRDLDLDGRLRIAELKVAGLVFADSSLEIRVKDGNLGIDNQVQGFYQGRLTGRLGLDVRGAEPRVALAQQAAGIQMGPLLQDLTGEAGLTGRGDFTADLAAVGWTEDALRRSLAGRLAIQVGRGAVMGFSLERLVREAAARLTGRPPPADLPLRTDFTDLSASAEVRGGVFSNSDLIANSDYLRMTGGGTVDLGNERLDYRFEPMFVRPPRGRGIKELEGVPIPVRLTGTFDRPLWHVDAASALREVGKRRIEERLDGQGAKAIEKLEERTGIKGLEQGLRGLLGR